nr:reverse transcriptase domain-containing protein [Tanacetum cinerariifolium]
MSTRSSARNLFPPLDIPELTIRRRPRVDPTLLNDFEMATDRNGDPPLPDLRTMEELCQPTLNGRGGPIASIATQATNFGLKNDMIQQVQNTCQFHRLLDDDANKYLDKFLHVTQSIKVNGVTDDALRLYLFPNSLTHHATAWFDCFPRNSINTFEQMEKMFLGKYFPPSMVTKLRNEITNFCQRPDESLFEAWEPYQAPAYQAPGYQASVHQAPIPQPQVVTTNEFTNYMKANDAILKNMQTNMTSLKNSNLELKNMFGQFMKMNIASSLGSGTLPSNTITNPKEDLKGITTRSGNAYKGPMIPTTSSLPKVMERETEVTKDTMPPTNNGSTKDVQPPVIQIETSIPNSEPVVSPDVEPVIAPFGLTIKSLLTNKERLFELARTPLNEHCSTVLLKKLLEKLRDPGKFLILCDLSGMDECLALADLGASINLMPLSVWNKLSLPELSPTCMTLELLDRAISRPVGVTEDVFVKVGTRSFSKTGRALVKVYEEELTLLNRIDLIDVACEEYSQEVLGFFVSGNPTPSTKPIVSNSSPTLTPFGDRSIILLEEFLNDDPSSSLLPPQELKAVEPTNEKSSINEPTVVELKDLPPHLEYAFLEGDDKLPVIIAKDLKDEEKTALIKVLKSHKQALA